VRTDVYAALRGPALQWADTPATRELIAQALSRVAKRDGQAAMAAMTSAAKHFAFTSYEQGLVARELVRRRVQDYEPNALIALAQIPVSAFDDSLHEWRLRYLLKAQRWDSFLAAVAQLPPTLAEKENWRYAHARVLELVGRASEALPIYQALASQLNFHGVLAADRAGADYPLCDSSGLLDSKLSISVLARNDMRRFFALNDIGWRTEAMREWMAMLARMSPAERRQAGLIASKEGLNNQAILALNQPADRSLLSARFPLAHQDTLRKAALDHDIDAAWLAGLIRQESAWNPLARSHADARGLTQLLPSTAARLLPKVVSYKVVGKGKKKRTVKVETLARPDLYDVDTSLDLGAKYLSLNFRHQDSDMVTTTAAYNAGPNAVAKWKDALLELAPDLWVETIPYFETREYVARVLMYSVIYDWRLDGALRRLSGRLRELPRSAPPVRAKCPMTPTTIAELPAPPAPATR
jgi:soluble lytic murein transglycosylase